MTDTANCWAPSGRATRGRRPSWRCWRTARAATSTTSTFAPRGSGSSSLSDDEKVDLTPLFESIVETIPGPQSDTEGVFQMLVSTIDYSPYLGRLAIGRIERGVAKVGEPVVLLDHEVIHFGDPAFDLGFSLAHLLSKAHHLRHRREAFLTGVERYWLAYRRALGPDEWAPGLEARAVRHSLGCLLARVAGRSPLEYLGDEERRRQRTAVVALMRETPKSLRELVDAWRSSLRGIDADH